MRVAYLDIETDYVGKLQGQELFQDVGNHKLTVIGIRILDGENDSFVQLVGPEATKENLLQALRGVHRIVTYNGRSFPDSLKGRTGFDFPVIAAQLGITLDRIFEHVDLVPVCWQNNLYGGLKKVEEALGLKRQLPGRDGKWATETWKNYQRTNDRRYLDELLAYNKEDVFMLREVELALEKRKSAPKPPG